MSRDNKGYSIFEIFVFVVFFPVILLGWIFRYVAKRKKEKEIERVEQQKIDLLKKIAEND